MNWLHRRYCRSARWHRTIAALAAWALADVTLGREVLELGPGPGVTTSLLSARAPRVTAIDSDGTTACVLRSRSGVAVVQGDAAALPFGPASFSAVAAFTMLHHVRSAVDQDHVLAEVARVLTPGGVLVGCDIRAGCGLRLAHLGDTYVPIDPTGFGARLRQAGLTAVRIDVRPGYFRFLAVSETIIGRDRVPAAQAERL